MKTELNEQLDEVESGFFIQDKLVAENRKLKRDLALTTSKLQASRELIKRLNDKLLKGVMWDI